METEDQKKKALIEQYLMEKNSQPEADSERARLVAESEKKTPEWRQRLAKIGASMLGNDPNKVNVHEDQDRAKKALADHDENAWAKESRNQQRKEWDQSASRNDPNSQQAVVYRELLKKVSPNLNAEGLGVEDIKALYKDASSHADRNEARSARAQQNQNRIDDKKELDLREREVGGVGVARTRDDAKQLKEATETKSKFDSQVQEMIDLRKKHGGGALLNREDVARGKQLSNDLLLSYKSLAKLGVLSATDKNIINAIIPEDPLAYDWSPGDPILHKMEEFQNDSNKDYESRLKTRLEKRYEPTEQPASFPMTVRNPSTGETAEVSNDQELAEAKEGGFQ